MSFLSVFSGMGGLDLGLEAAGFRNLACIEFDPIARASRAANRPSTKFISPHDVTQVAENLKPRDLGIRRRDLCILAGGPPCQPFSKAAQWSHRAMRGLKDPRAKCLAGFVKLIEEFLPRAVVIENVQGFVSGRNSAIRRLEKSFYEINASAGTKYRLSWRVVDACGYGVPQRRKRAILIACRDGEDVPLPAPTHAERPVTAWEAFRGLRRPKEILKRPGNWGALLPSIPEGWNYLWHTRKGKGRPLFGYRTRFWSFLLKLSKHEPAWTISAQPGPYTGPFHWDNRPLTSQELLRLQSFPLTWEVRGTRLEQVRQIGNATPPLLAEIIGRAVAGRLLGKRYRKSLTLAIPRLKTKIPASKRLRPIPKHFKKMVRRRADHPGAGLGPAPIIASALKRVKRKKT